MPTLADPFTVRGRPPRRAGMRGWDRLALTVPQTRLHDARQGPREPSPAMLARQARMERLAARHGLPVPPELLQAVPEPVAFIQAMLDFHGKLPTTRALAKRCNIEIDSASALLESTIIVTVGRRRRG